MTLAVCLGILAAFLFVAAGSFFEEKASNKGMLFMILGVMALASALLIGRISGYGNAATDLDNGTVYCIAAKVDDTYVVRRSGENKNMMFYLPKIGLSAGDCFVKTDPNGTVKVVAPTPAK